MHVAGPFKRPWVGGLHKTAPASCLHSRLWLDLAASMELQCLCCCGQPALNHIAGHGCLPPPPLQLTLLLSLPQRSLLSECRQKGRHQSSTLTDLRSLPPLRCLCWSSKLKQAQSTRLLSAVEVPRRSGGVGDLMDGPPAGLCAADAHELFQTYVSRDVTSEPCLASLVGVLRVL